MLFRKHGAHQRPVAQPRQQLRLLRRVAAVVLALGIVGSGLANAQGIDDLRAKAARIQAALQDSREEIEAQAEAYNRATSEQLEAEQQAEKAGAQLRGVQVVLEQRRSSVADFALSAYVRGGSLSNLDSLLAGDPNDAGARLTYLKTAAGDSKQAMDALKAVKEDIQRSQAQLDRAKAVAKVKADEADRGRSAAQQAAEEHRRILAGLDQDITELVRQEEARVYAAEQAAAENVAKAAATASAAAAAARTESVASRPLLAALSQTTSPPAATEPPAPVRATPASPVSPAGIRPAASIAMDAAYSVIGVPYVWAGASPSGGFDCSGLVQWAWGKAGRNLSHAADWQRDESEPISASELEPGDLIFYGEPPSHVAIYAGAGQIINAPYTGQYVRVQSMYYSSKPMTFGRVN